MYVRNINKVKAILIIHVDDGIIVSSEKRLIAEIIECLRQVFKIKVLKLKCLVGIEIVERNDCIYIHKKKYIKRTISRFDMDEANPISTPVDANVILSKGTSDTLLARI